MPDYFLRPDLAAGSQLEGGDVEALLAWGKKIADEAPAEDVFRNKEGRKTLRFTRNGRPYFLKLHLGVGWGEIFKNLLQLRLPILGAKNEYLAVEALTALGVDTLSLAGYTSFGVNPAARQSLIITDDLVGTVSLEDYCMDWATQPPPPQTRMRLILKVADSARRMHGAGINHRDFYLCHFHLDESTLNKPPIKCHLIDLHRAQQREQVPRRWQVKDLAGLYFSAMDCGLSQRDLLRFIRHYVDGGLREAFGPQKSLWTAVNHAAQKLYRKDHGKNPPALLRVKPAPDGQ